MMNALQKATLLVTAGLLPLLLLFMSAMAYPGIGIVCATWIALSILLMWALRHTRTD
jgi:hypothetical protein